MRRPRQRKTISLLVGGYLSILANIATAEYVVIVPDYTDDYASVGRSIIESVPNHKGLLVRYSDLALEQKQNIQGYELVISIGNEVTQSINQDKRFDEVPTINTFILKSEYKAKSLRSAVLNNVNPAIHLKLIKKMFPDKEPRIGVFVDSVTDSLFKDEFPHKMSGFVLIPKKLNQGENPARIIESFVYENGLDVFIVLPSSIIYDPHSLTAMLYSLYKHNVAAIAYTPKLVEGGVGCVAAAYFDKALVVSEIANRIHSFYKTGVLAEEASTPATAKIIVNEQLARSLQLDLSNLMKYGEIHEQ